MPKKFQLKDLMSANGGDGEVRDNFKDALRDLYKRINHAFEHGPLTQQWIETAVWIDVEDTDVGLRGPIYFYDARDVAVKHGLIDDGARTVNEDGHEPDGDMLVEVALLCAVNGGAEEYIKGLKAVA